MKLFDRAELSNDIHAACTEFLGTMVFLLLGLGGIQAAATSSAAAQAAASSGSSSSSSVNTVASTEDLMYISASMGLALLVSAWLFYRVSGSVFNPNVALALVICKVLTFQRFVFYVVAQFVGSIAASAILSGLLPGPLVVTPSLGAGTSLPRGVFIEMFITTALCLVVLMIAAEKHKSTYLAPIAIGLVLFVSHLWAVIYTGSAQNTARAFGPSVITGFHSNHWVYWVGPGLGALLASAIYYYLKVINYLELNPGQDASQESESPDVLPGDGPDKNSKPDMVQQNGRHV